MRIERMYRPFVLILAALVACPQVQGPEFPEMPEVSGLGLEPGDRIRLHGPFEQDPLVSARVVSTGPIYLGFSLDGRPDLVFTRAFATIDTLDVRHRSRWYSAQEGATWGLFLVTAAGMIAGPLLAPGRAMETSTAIVAYGAGGAILGIVSGAAAGAVIAPIRWYRYVIRGQTAANSRD